jgi:hypothetical protein
MQTKTALNMKGHINTLLLGLSLSLLSAPSISQSVPSDLLDLSIEDLFAAEIEDNLSQVAKSNLGEPNRWRLQYRFLKAEFGDYGDGTRKLSNDEVLFLPGTEVRTDKNFPVVPTTITQEVHAIIASYNFEHNIQVMISASYVKQSTDHISIISGYDFFTINSSGIGDVSVIGSYDFNSSVDTSWQFGIGVSLPTGSIDKKGDTPRAPGLQQLPYTMQVGSGTYDMPINIAYARVLNSFNWGGELAAKVRFGKNDRDYRLGNRVMFTGWIRFKTFQWVKPSLKLTFEHSGSIHGLDTELLVPAAFPYPAPVTNPKLFGGKQANIILGLRFPLKSARQSVDLEIGKPIYQSLNGPQTRENIFFGVKYNLNL